MTELRTATRETILAVDIGATTIKFGVVDAEGHLVDDVLRVATPYPCSPSRLIEFITEQIALSGCSRVGVGFPGDLREGLVIEPGNLSRPKGFTSEIDPLLLAEWQNINLEQAIRNACHQDVRVVNDATLAALGCSEGAGNELVFTLGTGFGIALLANGEVIKIRDVGAELYCDGQSYDRVLGEFARSQDEVRWNGRLHRAVNGFVEEFSADTVHLGGGNSRRVDLTLFSEATYRIVVNNNDATLRGAVKLFDR
ncbi:MAG TPA: ROK family protein [Acidimicrobiales bacterium]|nr:ROK family protein [Acidimicrobiales bacterium]